MQRFRLIVVVATVLWACPLFAADHADLGQWTQRLSSSKPKEREEALAALAQLGPAAASAVPRIAELLDDKSSRVRYEALRTIEQIGANAGAAVVYLARLLESGQPGMKLGAIQALGAIGPEAEPTLATLMKITEGDDLAMAAAAVMAVVRIQPDKKEAVERSIPVLMKALAGSNALARRDAAVGLSGIGQAASAPLIAAVRNHAKDHALAARAAAVLGMTSPLSEEAIPALSDALSSRDAAVQEAAARALGAAGERAAAAREALTKLLTSKTPAVRGTAARALGGLGASAADSAPALAALVKDPEPFVRREAVRALGALGPKGDGSIEALVVALGDSHGQVTMHAATSLAQMGAAAAKPVAALLKLDEMRSLALLILADLGPDAASVVSDLVATLRDKDPAVVREAHLALANVGPPAASAVPELLKTVKDEGSEVRSSAAYALVRIAEKERVLPVLAETVKQANDRHLRAISAWGLVMLGPDDPTIVQTAIPPLTEGLSNPWSLIRRRSAAALGELGPAAESSVEPLAEAIVAEKDPSVRNEILVALAAIGPAAESSMPAILQSLGDTEAAIRYSACYAAGKIGPGARKAVPVLRKNLRDEHDPFLAFVSAWALVHIDREDPGLPEDVVPILSGGLSLPHRQSRLEAIHALETLGVAARPAVKSLEPLSDDKDDVIREAARQALEKIRG